LKVGPAQPCLRLPAESRKSQADPANIQVFILPVFKLPSFQITKFSNCQLKLPFQIVYVLWGVKCSSLFQIIAPAFTSFPKKGNSRAFLCADLIHFPSGGASSLARSRPDIFCPSRNFQRGGAPYETIPERPAGSNLTDPDPALVHWRSSA
jgi:hypothetical protein